MKDDRLYVIHVLECIERIERYTVEGKRLLVMIPRLKMPSCVTCRF